MRTFNRCVKNRLQILNRLWKKWKNVRSPRGDFLLTHTVYNVCFAASLVLIHFIGFWFSLHSESGKILPRPYGHIRQRWSQIPVSLALSWTPAEAARSQMGQCIVWYARLLLVFCWYSLTDTVGMALVHCRAGEIQTCDLTITIATQLLVQCREEHGLKS